MQPKKEKPSRKKKVIKGREHFCTMGPTQYPGFVKCYFCDRVEKV